MNSFRIAYNNFKHNLKTYELYLMAMIFSVAVYYNFVSLKYNPEVVKIKSAISYVAGTSKGAAVILLVFLIFFVWYSNSFFLKQRKKEIGIYAFMGIDNSQIALIFTIETFLIGLVALAAGLFLGVLFGKLFMMILAKVALLNIKIDFFISLKGLAETTIIFLIIFTLVSIKGYFEITRSRLIDLFNAEKKEEGLPKVNYLKGIFSIILIGAGYYTSSIVLEINFMRAIMITLVLVIWGTYWLFGSFFSAVTKYLLNKKSFLYNGVNIISISNIAFRIKNNYRTMATIAVLIMTTVTAFGTVTSQRYFVRATYDIEVPYTFSYISDDKSVIERVDKVISSSNHDIILKEEANYLKIDKEDFVVVSFSDFAKITRDLNIKDGEEIISRAKPLEGEVTYVERPGVMMSLLDYKDIEIGNINFKITTDLKTPLFGNGVPRVYIVVNDKDYLRLRSRFPEEQFKGIILDKQENIRELTKTLVNVLPDDARLYSSYWAHQAKFDIIGIIYFMGAFLALIFVLATGSIIYFKTLSDAFSDKLKYDILTKLGMTKSEIYKAVSKQVGISFILPLIIGSIHSCVAISALSRLMRFNLVLPTIVSILIFTVVYGIFYLVTTRKFLRLIS